MVKRYRVYYKIEIKTCLNILYIRGITQKRRRRRSMPGMTRDCLEIS